MRVYLRLMCAIARVQLVMMLEEYQVPLFSPQYLAAHADRQHLLQRVVQGITSGRIPSTRQSIPMTLQRSRESFARAETLHTIGEPEFGVVYYFGESGHIWMGDPDGTLQRIQPEDHHCEQAMRHLLGEPTKVAFLARS